MLVDSHCHLDRLPLDKLGCDLPQLLTAARAAGVGKFLCVCISAANRAQVVALAEAEPDVYASVGVHPSDVTESVVELSELAAWAAHPKVVALGETGLDFYYDRADPELQQQSFRHHLIAGKQLDLPVIVHTRAARAETLALIKAESGPRAGVLHCFTEDYEMASAAMDHGYYISISGIVTFTNAADLREVVRKLPLERLLVETDSPYLAPMPYRGKPNQPAYVRQVAEYVAQLKGVSLEELAEISTRNFHTLFYRAA